MKRYSIGTGLCNGKTNSRIRKRIVTTIFTAGERGRREDVV
jgi:hypothetical protein